MATGSARQASMRWRTAPDAASPASFQPVKAAMSTGDRKVGREDHRTCSIARTLPARRTSAGCWCPRRPPTRAPALPGGVHEPGHPGAQLLLGLLGDVGPTAVAPLVVRGPGRAGRRPSTRTSAPGRPGAGAGTWRRWTWPRRRRRRRPPRRAGRHRRSAPAGRAPPAPRTGCRHRSAGPPPRPAGAGGACPAR